MFHILVKGTKIIDMVDTDRVAKPVGAIAITPEQHAQISASPYGFAAFDYVGGELVQNTTFTDERTLVQARNKKKNEIRRECLRRIAGINKTLADDGNLALVIELVKAGFNPTAGSDISMTAEIYRYARKKINQAASATQEQLDNYDPATDTNWP